jgi:uncharacterized integral membrane protein (TIGR00698 family)
MTTASSTVSATPAITLANRRLPPLAGLLSGFAVSAAIALAATALSDWSPLAHAGIGALTLAIALGIVAGNLLPGRWHAASQPGLAFSQRTLLRSGVAIYGLRLSLQQVGAAGIGGIVTDTLMLVGTLLFGIWFGMRVLKLDRETSLLVATGSAICGAAAVMAAEPVVKAAPHKVAVAVATVTIFGSLAIFVYPLLYPLSGMTEAGFGTYIGSTVHEVAQVVAAGKAVSPATADEAVIVKLIRVLMLAPALLLIGRFAAVPTQPGEKLHRPRVPGFVWAFAAAVVINSLGILPAGLRGALLIADAGLLTVAMAALGTATRASLLRQAGVKPLLLGAVLFAFLISGGFAVNRLVAWII